MKHHATSLRQQSYLLFIHASGCSMALPLLFSDRQLCSCTFSYKTTHFKVQPISLCYPTHLAVIFGVYTNLIYQLVVASQLCTKSRKTNKKKNKGNTVHRMLHTHSTFYNRLSYWVTFTEKLLVRWPRVTLGRSKSNSCWQHLALSILCVLSSFITNLFITRLMQKWYQSIWFLLV